MFSRNIYEEVFDERNRLAELLNEETRKE